MEERRVFKNKEEFKKYYRNQVEIPVVEVIGKKSRRKYALIDSFTDIEKARAFIEGTNYLIWHHNSEVH
tara:strand:+ start:478 stop:684 length:207 start_codon:yes stop_codon:yes gene_type:complete